MQHMHLTAEVAHAVLLRLPEVMRLTGLGRSTIYRLLAAGEFPPSVRLSARAVGWRRSDVDGWIAARPQARTFGSNRPVILAPDRGARSGNAKGLS